MNKNLPPVPSGVSAPVYYNALILMAFMRYGDRNNIDMGISLQSSPRDRNYIAHDFIYFAEIQGVSEDISSIDYADKRFVPASMELMRSLGFIKTPALSETVKGFRIELTEAGRAHIDELLEKEMLSALEPDSSGRKCSYQLFMDTKGNMAAYASAGHSGDYQIIAELDNSEKTRIGVGGNDVFLFNSYTPKINNQRFGQKMISDHFLIGEGSIHEITHMVRRARFQAESFANNTTDENKRNAIIEDLRTGNQKDVQFKPALSFG